MFVDFFDFLKLRESSCVQLKRLRLFFVYLAIAWVSLICSLRLKGTEQLLQTFTILHHWLNELLNALQIVDEHVVVCHPHSLELDQIFLKCANVKSDGVMAYQTSQNISGIFFSYVFISCLWGSTMRSCCNELKGNQSSKTTERLVLH